jgi:hypothetical protein
MFFVSMSFANVSPIGIGDYALSFSLPAINEQVSMRESGNTQVSMSMYTGLAPQKKTKALVLYFFNLSEGGMLLSELERVQKHYRKEGVYIIAICTEGGSVTPISRWVEGNVNTIPVLRDKYQIVQSRYGIQKVPQVYVVDEIGRIFAQAEPKSKGIEKELRRELDELIRQSDLGQIVPQ